MQFRGEQPQYENPVIELKQSSRKLTETRVEQGKLKYVNGSMKRMDVKERCIIVFTGDQVNASGNPGDRRWEFGRVVEIGKGGENKVKVARVEMKNQKRVFLPGGTTDVMVNYDDVKLSCDSQPGGITSCVEVSDNVLNRINFAIV